MTAFPLYIFTFYFFRMAPEEMAAVLRSPNQLCYCVCFFVLFVTYLYIMSLPQSLMTENSFWISQFTSVMTLAWGVGLGGL
jgi:hypothetical protein